MIKNIVFDLGNVLLDFKPEEYLQQNYSDSELIEELYRKLFSSPEWEGLDRGTLTRQEAVEKLGAKHPELKPEIKEILASLDKLLQPKQETISLLNSLAETEYNLYVLSNFHQQAYQEVAAKYDFFDHFDGLVISAQINYIKPETEIYKHLLAEFELTPEKTVFIDDKKENLAGAEEFGIKTIHFAKNIDYLKQELAKLNIL